MKVKMRSKMVKEEGYNKKKKDLGIPNRLLSSGKTRNAKKTENLWDTQ